MATDKLFWNSIPKIILLVLAGVLLHEIIPRFAISIMPIDPWCPVENSVERVMVLKGKTVLSLVDAANPCEKSPEEGRDVRRLYVLPEGLHVRVLSSDSHISKVKLPDGSVGYIPSGDITGTNFTCSIYTSTTISVPGEKTPLTDLRMSQIVTSQDKWQFALTDTHPYPQTMTLTDDTGKSVTMTGRAEVNDPYSGKIYLFDKCSATFPTPPLAEPTIIRNSFYVEKPGDLSLLEGHRRSEIEGLLGAATSQISSALSRKYDLAYYEQLAIADGDSGTKGVLVYYADSVAVLCRPTFARKSDEPDIQNLLLMDKAPSQNARLRTAAVSWSKSTAATQYVYEGPVEFNDTVDTKTRYHMRHYENWVAYAIFPLLFFLLGLLTIRQLNGSYYYNNMTTFSLSVSRGFLVTLLGVALFFVFCYFFYNYRMYNILVLVGVVLIFFRFSESDHSIGEWLSDHKKHRSRKRRSKAAKPTPPPQETSRDNAA